MSRVEVSMHRLANGRLEATIRLVGWKRRVLTDEEMART